MDNLLSDLELDEVAETEASFISNETIDRLVAEVRALRARAQSAPDRPSREAVTRAIHDGLRKFAMEHDYPGAQDEFEDLDGVIAQGFGYAADAILALFPPSPSCGTEEVKVLLEKLNSETMAMAMRDLEALPAGASDYMPSAEFVVKYVKQAADLIEALAQRVEEVQAKQVEYGEKLMERNDTLIARNVELLEARAALADLKARGVAEGFVVVPREPTEAMLSAADSAVPRFEPDDSGHRLMGVDGATDIWHAMLANLPAPPVSEGGEP